MFTLRKPIKVLQKIFAKILLQDRCVWMFIQNRVVYANKRSTFFTYVYLIVNTLLMKGLLYFVIIKGILEPSHIVISENI